MGRPSAEDVLNGTFVRFIGVVDPPGAVVKLNQAGIEAQVNHVLFAHLSPPPGDGAGFYANPFYANPFYANPFYANPFYANPFYANTQPGRSAVQETGRRQSLARPGKRPAITPLTSGGKRVPRIVILDTGYAAGGFWPTALPQHLAAHLIDEPDGDRDTYLDPVAGHGTFIAGIIESLVPGCDLEVLDVINPYGDGDEATISTVLDLLAEKQPDLVNLSFGGYALTKPGMLTDAVNRLHHAGTAIVASAGNDASPFPMYPAALPNVVAVGALDHAKQPAPFTNYGPWVRASALGVEVVSTFFAGFNGAHPSQAGDEIDEFDGWAVWSGTSFAAPRVVAELAAHIRDTGSNAHESVRDVIDLADRERIPQLGKVIGFS